MRHTGSVVHVDYIDVLRSPTLAIMTARAIQFAVQNFSDGEPFTILTASTVGAFDSPERTAALRDWLKNRDHGVSRLVARWSRDGEEQVRQDWLVTRNLTARRGQRLAEGRLARSLVVCANAGDVLAAIRAQPGPSWSFAGVRIPPNSWIRAVIAKTLCPGRLDG